MKLKNFEHLPDPSRVWIHGFRDPVGKSGRMRIFDSLEEFLPTWKTHGQPVESAFDLFEDRFLITGGYAPGGLSGCAIDSYVRVLRELRESNGLDALNGGLIFFRDQQNQIRAVDHLDFYEVTENGLIEPETPVFDTLIQDLATLRKAGIEKAYRDSWHARTYPLPPGRQRK